MSVKVRGPLPIAPPETLEATSCVASSAEYQGVRTWELLPYLKIDGMLEYIAESVFLRWLEGLGRKLVYFDVLKLELIRVKWQA
jgi:hypothetical protein